jgi:hypothetical protein
MDNVTSDMAPLLERARFAIGRAVARVATRQRALELERTFTEFAISPLACCHRVQLRQRDCLPVLRTKGARAAHHTGAQECRRVWSNQNYG